jgi:hypothetical protein
VKKSHYQKNLLYHFQYFQINNSSSFNKIKQSENVTKSRFQPRKVACSFGLIAPLLRAKAEQAGHPRISKRERQAQKTSFAHLLQSALPLFAI